MTEHEFKRHLKKMPMPKLCKESRKSRKNILGLIEALQIQQNSEGKRATGNAIKKKENNPRKESTSPRGKF